MPIDPVSTNPATSARKFRQTVRRLFGNEHVVLAVLAVVIGAAVAYAALAFRAGIDLVQRLSFGFSGEAIYSLASELAWWHILLVTTGGGLVIGLMLQFLFRDQRIHGVADVVEANALRDARIPLRTGLMAAVGSAASLGFGASAGREGPVVHLGASLAAWVSERLMLSPALARTQLGCGVAAAVAASFNAPIAGVFFALEVIVGHYSLHAFAPVVIASVVGTVVTRLYLGDFPAFILPDMQITSFSELPAFAILGVVSALVAVGFMRLTISASDVFEKTIPHVWLRPVLAGLIVGLIAIPFPHVLGVGYEATDAALKNLLPLSMLLALVFLKTFTTAVSIGGGFGGGVFSPSIYIGAMTGGAFAAAASAVMPDLASAAPVYSVVGMGAVAGAVLGAPISTIFIVFELTGDYPLTIAVMVSTAIASLVTYQTYGTSFFRAQLDRLGLDLSGGKARRAMMRQPIDGLLTDQYKLVDANATYRDLQRLLKTLSHANLVVVDEDQRLIGVLSFAEIRDIILDPEFSGRVRAGDLARATHSVLARGESLDSARQLFETSGEDYMPVVEKANSRKVIGVIRQKDVLMAYNRALIAAEREEHPA